MGNVVSVVAKETKQPRGGYLPVRKLEKILLNDIDEVNLDDVRGRSVHASLIGLSVDYLSRFMIDKNKEKAFAISLKGASLLGRREFRRAKKYLRKLGNGKKVKPKNVEAAIRLVGYDCVYRAGPMVYIPVQNIRITINDIFVVLTLLTRSLEFINSFGPVILYGINFPGGYTYKVINGDCDFITEDTLWDFKASKSEPTKINTLQLLLYWRLLVHSEYAKYINIKYIGIFNPYKNCIYRHSVEEISPEVIEEIDRNIIGYK